MDASWIDLLKLYGPQAVPWIALAYFGKWHLDRLDRDMEGRMKMATVLEGILKTLERLEQLEQRNNAKP